MKSFYTLKKVMKSCILATTLSLSFAYANDAETFVNSSKNFGDTVSHFNTESNRLMNNTHEVDKTLLDFEHTLLLPHKTADALNTLDRTLQSVKLGLMVAEQIPQTKAQATKLKSSLEIVHKPISSAAKTVTKIDKAIHPLLVATDKAEKMAAKTIDLEGDFSSLSHDYFEGIHVAQMCNHGKSMISIMDGSSKVYQEITKDFKIVNDKYESAKKIPEEIMHQITQKIKGINDALHMANMLNSQLHPLQDPLDELKQILDKKIGVKPSYPCGPKICYHETKYPCGTKTCKKNCGFKTCKYPCGVKYCTQKTPYPCGVKECDIDITMSVADALQGADFIENKIQSMISATALSALKKIGLDGVIKEIEHKANALVKPILAKLHLNLDISEPKLDVSLDMNYIQKAISDLNAFEVEMAKFESMLDYHGKIFNPYIIELNKYKAELKKLVDCEKKLEIQLRKHAEHVSHQIHRTDWHKRIF